MNPNAFSQFLAQNAILINDYLYELRMINDNLGNTQYLGISIIPNANPANPVWMILKFSLDGNGFVNRQQLPDNGTGFLYVFNDYASYFS
jgi:hypothetical protein